MHREHERRSIGWMGLKRGHRARPLEWIAEKFIFLVSLTSILMVFLIFVFIGREALPVIFGRTNTALVQKVIPVEKMDELKPAELREYLNLTETQLKELDRESIRALMEVRLEYVKEHSEDPDANINSTSWRYLLGPHRWAGYSKPEYIKRSTAAPA